MAFEIELKLPDLESAATVEKWLVPTDEYIGWDQPILALKIGDQRRRLICNMPVIIRQLLAKAGANLHSDQPIAVIWAEGDEIPYGKPYARID